MIVFYDATQCGAFDKLSNAIWELLKITEAPPKELSPYSDAHGLLTSALRAGILGKTESKKTPSEQWYSLRQNGTGDSVIAQQIRIANWFIAIGNDAQAAVLATEAFNRIFRILLRKTLKSSRNDSKTAQDRAKQLLADFVSNAYSLYTKVSAFRDVYAHNLLSTDKKEYVDDMEETHKHIKELIQKTTRLLDCLTGKKDPLISSEILSRATAGFCKRFGYI